MFVDVSGEVYRIVSKAESGTWIISYENPCSPYFVSEQDLKAYPRIEPPQEYLKYIDNQKNLTKGQRKRLELISELMEDEIYIMDKRAPASEILANIRGSGSGICFPRVQEARNFSIAGPNSSS